MMTKFWYDDYTALYAEDRYSSVFPNSSMPLAEKLNAIVRLSFFVGVFLIVSTGDFRYIVIPAITMMATFYLYKYRFDDIQGYFENYKNKDSGNLGHAAKKGKKKKDDKKKNDKKGDVKKGDEKDDDQKKDDDKTDDEDDESVEEGFAMRGNTTTRPTDDNPFMNPNLITDPRDKPRATLNINNPELDEQITKMFDKNLFQETGDIFNKENSQRQFITVPSTVIGGEQTSFAKWLYQAPPTCKEDTIKCAPLWG